MAGRTERSRAIKVDETRRWEDAACVLCGAPPTAAAGPVPQADAAAIVRCVGCGLGRLRPAPRLDDAPRRALCADGGAAPRPGRVRRWASALVRDVAAASPGRGERLRVLRPLVRPLAEWAFDVVVPLDGRRGVCVLAMGDEHGDLRAHLTARGCSVTSVDADRAVQHGPQPAASYDAAVVGGRLAHEADPLAALRAIARLLRRGGRLYVVVPNLAAASRELDGADWEPLAPPVPRWCFDAASLALLVEAAGLRVVRGPHARTASREAVRVRRELRDLGARAAARRSARRLAAWLRTAGSGDVLRLEAERA